MMQFILDIFFLNHKMCSYFWEHAIQDVLFGYFMAQRCECETHENVQNEVILMLFLIWFNRICFCARIKFVLSLCINLFQISIGEFQNMELIYDLITSFEIVWYHTLANKTNVSWAGRRHRGRFTICVVFVMFLCLGKLRTVVSYWFHQFLNSHIVILDFRTLQACWSTQLFGPVLDFLECLLCSARAHWYFYERHCQDCEENPSPNDCRDEFSVLLEMGRICNSVHPEIK